MKRNSSHKTDLYAITRAQKSYSQNTLRNLYGTAKRGSCEVKAQTHNMVVGYVRLGAGSVVFWRGSRLEGVILWSAKDYLEGYCQGRLGWLMWKVWLVLGCGGAGQWGKGIFKWL